MTLALSEPVTDSHAQSVAVRWQIDRRVPIALILTILMQTAVFGVWLGRTEARVDALEQFERDNKATDTRLAVIENRLDSMREKLREIGHKLNVEE